MQDFFFMFQGEAIKGSFSFLSKKFFKGYFSKEIFEKFSIIFQKKTFEISFDVKKSIQKNSFFYIEAESQELFIFYKAFLSSFRYSDLYKQVLNNDYTYFLHALSLISQEDLWKILKKEFVFSINPIWKKKVSHVFHDDIFFEQKKYHYILKYQGVPVNILSSAFDFSEFLPMIQCIQGRYQEKEMPQYLFCEEKEAILMFRRKFQNVKYAINSFDGFPCLFTNVKKERSLDYYYQSTTLAHFTVLDSLEKRPLDLAFYLQDYPNFKEMFSKFLYQENLTLEEVESSCLSLNTNTFKVVA